MKCVHVPIYMWLQQDLMHDNIILETPKIKSELLESQSTLHFSIACTANLQRLVRPNYWNTSRNKLINEASTKQPKIQLDNTSQTRITE